MRVGFFLDNSKYKTTDFSNPMQGNPGVRGTQYMIWTIACFLNDAYKDIETIIFAPYVDKMPKNQKCEVSQNDIQALEKAKELNIDIMVLRSYNENPEYFEKIDKINIPCIMWSHNFENYRKANAFAKTRAIKRNVCVGRQQFERLRDHAVFSKSTYIYNTLDFDNYTLSPERCLKPIVTYVGALSSMKGFHMLAKAWHLVLKKVPNAELYVIGSGALGSNAKLGKHNLAVESYEQKFMKYLVNKEGDILPSVHFLGNMGGKEKKEIMGKSCVGIANPTGKGETFCIVAIEFEALGIPVVTAKKNGTLDTVINNQNGLLVTSTRQLADAIVDLLSDNQKAIRFGNNGYYYSRKTFSVEKVCDDWYRLLHSVYEDINLQNSVEYNHPFNQCKWLRELNRRFQKTAIGKNSPSILKYETVLRDLIRKM